MSNIEKTPFQKYNLDDENTNLGKKDVFSVRVNQEERKLIEELKELLDVKSDSKVLKIAARVGLNVLHGTFGKGYLTYLMKKDRDRLSNYK